MLRDFNSPGYPVVGAISFSKDSTSGNFIIHHLGSTGDVKGVGSELLRYVVEKAVKSSSGLVFESTPNAEGFYERTGFHHYDPSQSKLMSASPDRVKEILKSLGKPGRSLTTRNLARETMPQVRKADWEEFLAYAREHTTVTREDAVDPYDLHAIQSEWSQDRVDAIPMEKIKYPILVSRDGYVLDGNHRWIKAWQEGVTIPVLRLGLDKDDALGLVRSFPKSEYVENASTILSSRAKRKLVNNARKSSVGPNRIDPTRTTTMRRAFTQTLRKKFALLRGRVRALVVDEDAFGLKKLTENRFQFHSSPDKLAAFQEWIRGQLRSTVTSGNDRQLWQNYAQQGYSKGAGRAFDDTTKKSKRFGAGEGEFYRGSRSEFLRSSFGQPETVEKIQLLASRSFSDLENVTEDTATRMGRHLVDGLSQGMNPRDVASLMDEDLELGGNRAETIARTEIIRAHSEGQLDSMDKMGVETVGAEVEWSTAGDDRVCPECEDLEGKIYTIDEARGMIPIHPNCRCSWLPAGFDKLDSTEDEG